MPAASSRPPRAAVVLLAAGSGSRMQHDVNKVFLPLSGRRVFTWSLRWANVLPHVTHRVLVVAERDRELARGALAREAPGLDVEIVTGGDSRHASEWHALQALAPHIDAGEIDVVAIHDAARPLAGTPIWSAVIETAHRHGGAIPVRPQPALLPVAARAAHDGAQIVAVQTPQAFRAEDLLAAYHSAADTGFVGTDTASCVERFGSVDVHCVPGTAHNIKITFPEDLFLAEHLLSRADWDLSGGLEDR